MLERAVMHRRAPVVVVALGDERLREDVAPHLVVGRRHRRAVEVACAEPHQPGLDAVVVLVEPALDRAAVGRDDLGLQLLHAAEVVEHQLAVLAEREVRRVRIGVDDLEVEDLIADRAEQRRAQLVAELLRIAFGLVDVLAGLVGQREHALRAALTHHLRHHHLGVVLVVVAEEPHVVGFVAVVELLVQSRAQLGHERVEGRTLELHEPARAQCEAQVREIGIHGFVDAGVLHLHHDLATVVGLRAVDLTDRCGRERRLVEAAEQRLGRAAELLLDLLGDHLVGHRRRLALQGAERFGDLLRQDVARDRSHLPDLHHRALELAERLRDELTAARVLLGAIALGILLVLEHRLDARLRVAARHARGHARQSEQAAALGHRTIVHRRGLSLRRATTPCQSARLW